MSTLSPPAHFVLPIAALLLAASPLRADDAPNLVPTAEIKIGKRVTTLLANPRKPAIYALDADGQRVLEIDAKTHQVKRVVELGAKGSKCDTMAISPSGKRLVVPLHFGHGSGVPDMGELADIDTRKMRLRWRKQIPVDPFTISIDKKNRAYISGASNNKTNWICWDLSRRRELGRVRCSRKGWVRVDRSGRRLFKLSLAYSPRSTKVFDLTRWHADGRPNDAGTYTSRGGTIKQVFEIDRKGRLFARDGAVASLGDEGLTLDQRVDPWLAIAFAAKRVVLATPSGELVVLDHRLRPISRTKIRKDGRCAGVAIDASGTWLYAAIQEGKRSSSHDVFKGPHTIRVYRLP